MIRYKVTGIARRKPVTIMVELPHDSTEDSDWKATAAAATVLHRYRETGSDFKWHRKAEIVPAFDTKYFRRAMKLKDSSVWVPSDDRRFVVFLEAAQLLHFIGWLVAMFAPWWIFFRIGDAIQGTYLENWIGLPLVLIVLGTALCGFSTYYHAHQETIFMFEKELFASEERSTRTFLLQSSQLLCSNISLD